MKKNHEANPIMSIRDDQKAHEDQFAVHEGQNYIHESTGRVMHESDRREIAGVLAQRRADGGESVQSRCTCKREGSDKWSDFEKRRGVRGVRIEMAKYTSNIGEADILNGQ